METTLGIVPHEYGNTEDAVMDYIETRHRAIRHQIETLQAIDAEVLNFRQFLSACNYTKVTDTIREEEKRYGEGQ